MTRAVGIDQRGGVVRIAVLRALYRKIELDGLFEEVVGQGETVDDAIARGMQKAKGAPVDAFGATMSGTKTFVHALSLPASSEKRLGELLPFELEAELPLELDQVVFDYQSTRGKGGSAELSVLAVASRTEQVRALIESLRASTGLEPERIGDSALELGQLCRVCPELATDGPVLLLDLGLSVADACIVSGGTVRYGRTLPQGISSFPAGADALVLRLRQTMSAYATRTGEVVRRVVLMGDGAGLDGTREYLASRLEVATDALPPLGIEGGDELDRQRLPLFARAISSALHAARGGGFDLRQGALAFERGYGHLKERAPLLGGLALAIVISFLFATWAEGRALERRHEALALSLEQITKDTFGSATRDPDEASSLLEKARKARPEDPMPYLDGFGVAVALAETMPAGIKHDVEQLEYTKGKLKLRGLVDSTDEAQRVSKALGEHRCIGEPTITKISQVVNSERERYTLEADVLCPEDADGAKRDGQKAPAGGATKEGEQP